MLLDTCALLWLPTGSKKLSTEARRKIDSAPVVYVSAISAFEIASKKQKGKLNLPLPAAEWFHGVTDHHGLTVLPLDLEICVRAATLPPIHEDPCDRFIIATAKLHELAVVTLDERFESYGLTVIQ